MVEYLILEWRRAPRGRSADGREQVFETIGDAVQGTPVRAGFNFKLGAPCLLHRAVGHERDDGVVARTDTLQPFEEHLRQLGGRDLPLAYQFGQMTYGLVYEF